MLSRKLTIGLISFFCLITSAFPSYSQIQFIKNEGQWPAKAYYRADLVNGHLWLTDSGLLFSLWDADAAEQMHDRSLEQFTMNRHAFYLHFKNGDFSSIVSSGNQSETRYSYFLGNDSKHWAKNLQSTDGLLVNNLYPGVNLRIFSKDGSLKYNLECQSKAEVEQIELEYIGVDQLDVYGQKIEVQTSLQAFTDVIPLVYAEDEGVQIPVNAGYKRVGNSILFSLDVSKIGVKDRIVIDPVLVFSTYSGSKADNFGCTGTYDDLGHGFAGGTVFSVGLPVTLGAFQTTFGGGVAENIGYGDDRDAAILKFSPDGSKLLFCTYLGGSNNEQPHSMVTDATGNLYIMGSTRSKDFPVSNGAYDITQNGDYDFFVTVLSSDGTQLLASTYVGGQGLDAVGADREVQDINNFPLLYNYADEFRGEIITDGKNVYVSGTTYSINFPRSQNSGWFGGKEDACVFSLTADLKTLNWSQLVGKDGHDAFYGIAFGKHNDIYASGGTTSNNLPLSFPEFSNTYFGGLADGMVARFNKTTGKLVHASYIGTNLYEQAYFVQTDNAGNPLCYGQTEGVFPIKNAPFNQPGRGQFIVRLDSLLTNTTLSTSFGGLDNRPNISPSAFLVDECERIFVSGWGGKVNDHLIDQFTFQAKSHRNIGNTRNLPISGDAAQKTTDGSDFYVAIFNKGMYSLAYATYFGGVSGALGKEANEHVDGGTSRFDKKGIIYQSVCAGCGRNGLFPTTPGAYSRTNNSNNCNNALFKIDFENLNKAPVMADTFIEVFATENVQFSLAGVDPDPWDMVYLHVEYVNNGGAVGSNLPFIRIEPGAPATFAFNWTTDCSNWSKDTLELRIMIFDLGCPKSDTTYATVKILVKEPPHVLPPPTVCVSYDRNNGELKISWPESNIVNPINPKFFKYLILKRVYQGVTAALDTIRTTAAMAYIDKQVTDPSKEDYCYFLEGYNICDAKEAAIPFCTVRELNNPINGVRMKFATVEEDRRVKISWTASDEPDFKEYEVYRYKRNDTAGKIPLAYTTDSTFVDSSFNVDFESNCYRIIVADQCGHVSDLSNPGCNVIITGDATGRPDYYFDLNWQNYIGWSEGVSGWTLERQYNQYPWSILGQTSSSMLSARDNKLDFDWGGYWYRVTATEFVKSGNHAAESSQSNWIYLYQPPELWVPNAFTPEGNGINDVWGTVPVFVRNYSMKLYNRWGQKVWESTDKKRQWDGTVNGVKAEDGVFAWYVVFDGWDDKTYTMAGTVTILH